MTAGKSSCLSNGRGRSPRLFEGNRLSRGHLCRLMPKLCRAITGLLGWHGSASLCRDGQKTKWRLQCILTPIFHLVVNSTRLKTVRSAHWCCPNSTMAPRLLGNVVKVTKLEVVKIEFRHLPFLLSFFLLLQPA